MSLLPIIKLPDTVLRQVSTPVENFDADLTRLVGDMFETMYEAPGIGLAAIQVNVPKRLLVLDVADEDEGKQPLVLINPKIVNLGSEMKLYEEGCLSLPDVRIDIERPASLTVTYQDIDGQPQELTTDGLLATAIQHEIDHLDGKLIIDFLTRLKRDMIIRRFKKQARVM
jgi:peptide deformylase